MAEEKYSLEHTPTWTVAVVCSVFVIVCLCLERGIHRLGKTLQKRNQKALYESLQKVKEELMLLGFISLLLTVFEEPTSHICIPKSFTKHMLPCKRKAEDHVAIEGPSSESGTPYRKLFSVPGSTSRLLSEGASAGHCEKKGKAPFLSTEGMHQLHIFIFVLAIVHVVYCVLTMLLGNAKIRTWKPWEEEIRKSTKKMEEVLARKVTKVEHHDFVKRHTLGQWRKSYVLSWVVSFFKQFYGSVSKSDYLTLRLGFVQTHQQIIKKYDFYKCMMRAIEVDFKKVVGISGYLWFFVVIFLLLNIKGWHTYFWIAFIPLILLLLVGAKLEHVITQLAQEVAEKHTLVQGEIIVQPSDEHFWFGQPRLILYLIHFIIFQNAFEIAFLFWVLTTYGFNSCIMEKGGYIISRIFIGVIIQILCSYSTLPLYALVSQMGSSFKMSAFSETVQDGLLRWEEKAKRRVKKRSRTKLGSDTLIQMSKTECTSQSQTRIFHNSEMAQDLEAKIVAADIP